MKYNKYIAYGLSLFFNKNCYVGDSSLYDRLGFLLREGYISGLLVYL